MGCRTNPILHFDSHWEAWTLERLIYERSISLGLSLHPNTHHAYSSHLNSYLMFCQIHNFPVTPTPDMLVFMSHYIQPCSVENYSSGIVSQLEPHFPDICGVCNSDLVRHTLCGSSVGSLALLCAVSLFLIHIYFMPSTPLCDLLLMMTCVGLHSISVASLAFCDWAM